MIKIETTNSTLTSDLSSSYTFKKCQIPYGTLDLEREWKKNQWWFYFDAIPTVLESCEVISHAIVRQENCLTVAIDQTINGWIAFIREKFYSVPSVESIYFTIDNNNIDIWLTIPNRDFAVVRQLVQLEMELLNNFVTADQSQLFIEFHIVYRCGADDSQFIPREAIPLPR